MAQGST
ncbi:fumarase C family protein, partial [Vibrio parahaemolyticus V-223/04]